MKKQIALSTLLLLCALPSFAAADRDYLDWAGVRDAWRTTRGAGITIALLGTGVNYRLPELASRVVREADGSYGFDAVTGRHDPLDGHGIGTETASVALGNEFGVAPDAGLIPIRVFDEFGAGTLEALARGVHYAVDRGARILEIGGGPLRLDAGGALCAELQRAERAGALLVLPVGNEGRSLSRYPEGCALAQFVTVTALDFHGDLAAYSDFGFPAVHLAAPAEKIWRISRDGSTRKEGQGTSFSSAFAAGVAALVWSAHPQFSAADVKSALLHGAVSRDSLRGKVLAEGTLHAALALAYPGDSGGGGSTP